MPERTEPEQLTLDLAAARAARDHGIDLVGQNSDDWWRSTATTALEHLASTGRDFTSDDIRQLGVGDPHSINAWGALLAGAAKRGLIERVGYRQSARPESHARVVAIWRGV